MSFCLVLIVVILAGVSGQENRVCSIDLFGFGFGKELLLFFNSWYSGGAQKRELCFGVFLFVFHFFFCP